MILVEENFTNIIAEADSADSKGNKNLYIKGVFMEAEKQNQNGRVYQKKEINNAVDRVNSLAQQGRHVLGELDHPETLTVKLENVAHKITDMRMDGNQAIGKAMILTTPKGNIARSLIDSGVNIGVSSRGSGSVNESSGVVEGFDFITCDLVCTPSCSSAVPTSIYEALNYYRYGERIDDLSEAVRHDPKAQKYFNREMTKFIDSVFKRK